MEAKVFLRKKISDRISKGHPWVFANEIGAVEVFKEPGSVVTLFSAAGSFIGKGYYNPDSKISIRMLTYNRDEVIDKDFFLRKIKEALFRKKQLGREDFIYRVVAEEGDYLPGLIIDKIDQLIVFRITTLGMEQWKNEIVNALNEVFSDYSIYEEDSGKHRRPENLPEINRFWNNPIPFPITIAYHDLQLKIDPENSSETGFYWEHFFLAQEFKNLFNGKNILDAFCAKGFLALLAIKNGAGSVIGLDWDENLINEATALAKLNDLYPKAVFYQMNSFTESYTSLAKERPIDLIIFDPPPLFGIHRDIQKTLAGYERLIRRGLKVISDSGMMIITMSGYLFDEELLFERIGHITKEEGKKWQLIQRFTQPADHPVLWNVPVTEYFKGWLFTFMPQI